MGGIEGFGWNFSSSRNVTDRPGQRVLQGPWSDMTHFVRAWDTMLVSESSLDLRRMAVSQDAEFPGTV